MNGCAACVAGHDHVADQNPKYLNATACKGAHVDEIVGKAS